MTKINTANSEYAKLYDCIRIKATEGEKMILNILQNLIHNCNSSLIVGGGNGRFIPFFCETSKIESGESALSSATAPRKSPRLRRNRVGYVLLRIQIL